VMSKEWTFAFAMIMLVIDEASSVLNTLFLGYWSGSTISGFRQGDYMGLYAAFGGLQALCSFLGSYTLFLAGVRASYLLFDGALTGVLRSPNSFHDRTPVGRIVSRLTSDIERTDDRLTYAWYGYLSGLLSLVGLMSLVFYTFPALGALFVPLGLAFGVIGALYRHTSRESKRVSSVAQSFVYSSIGEQLDGMTTIRAFGLERTFQKKIRQTIDAIGSADYVAFTCRRWMVVRCEMLSAILLLGIVAFGLGYKNWVDPVKIGVVLTYTLRMGTAFQQTIEAATRTEQEMNATERLLHYTELPREAAPRVDDDPPKEWPQRGQVVFKRVCLQYRPDLPLVLRDISFQAEAGEKVRSRMYFQFLSYADCMSDIWIRLVLLDVSLTTKTYLG
jgi:ATP-binding cassette subfamily C (CFTR/MRP) protein 1